MTDTPHEQARHGLLASVTGKAKEVVGAVTGNDSLAREGALQQAEAAKRKEAITDRAVAEHEAEQAAAVLQAEHRVAEQQKQALEASGEARAEQVVDAALEERNRAAIENAQQTITEEVAAEAAADRAERQEQAATAGRLAEVNAQEASARAEAEAQRKSAEQAEQAAARVRAELNDTEHHDTRSTS